MNNLYYCAEFPEILETTYTIDSDTRRRMIDTVISQKDIADYHGGYTFHIQDPHGDFKKLYNYFFDKVSTVFGHINIAAKHKSWCWANVYNSVSFKTNMHNHVKTSSINAIYYLKIPKDIQDTEGGLKILNSITQAPIFFMPDPGDLIIMPGYVEHEPQQHSSLDYRIAINMEICINSPIENYYTRDKIYGTAAIKL